MIEFYKNTSGVTMEIDDLEALVERNLIDCVVEVIVALDDLKIDNGTGQDILQDLIHRINKKDTE